MKFITIFSCVAALAVAAPTVDDNSIDDEIVKDTKVAQDRNSFDSPIFFPVIAAVTLVNFMSAYQEMKSELSRQDVPTELAGPLWGTMGGVIYELSSFVVPLSLHFMMADEHVPDCQKQQLCEMNWHIQSRFSSKSAPTTDNNCKKMADSCQQRSEGLSGLLSFANNLLVCNDSYSQCLTRSDPMFVYNIFRSMMKQFVAAL